MICEAYYLVLIVLSCEETLFGAIIETLSIGGGSHLWAHKRPCRWEIFFLFKGHIAQKDTDVFSFDIAIIVKVVPKF